VGEIEKAMMSEGFAGPLGNGLPCGFRKRIAMAQWDAGCAIMKARAKAARAADNSAGKMKRRAFLPRAGARASANTSGPDPTDQEVAGEIADFKRPAPNEENLFFFCRTGPDRRKRLSEVRSSRLT
jgi:hypothetical protein